MQMGKLWKQDSIALKFKGDLQAPFKSMTKLPTAFREACFSFCLQCFQAESGMMNYVLTSRRAGQ